VVGVRRGARGAAGTALLAAGMAAVLAAGCATAPRPREASVPAMPGVWIDVRLKQPLAFGVPADAVWFARVAGLNGSDCVPRPRDFDPALEAAAPGAGAAGAALARIGAVEGEGGFGASTHPSCLYDEAGRPVWDPVLYAAKRGPGGGVLLGNPPPARYAAVAAVFKVPGGDGSVTVYFPEAMIARTEVPVPPGVNRFMGHYEVRYGGGFGSHGFDPAQSFFRDRIHPHRPSAAAKIATDLLTAALGGETQPDPDQAGTLLRAEAPDAPEGLTYPW